MDKIVKKILLAIENNGYEAYVVGGYVRDYLLGIKTYDIDICTNALPNEIYNIFKTKFIINNYGGLNLKINKYNIDITTFRKEITYENRRPIEFVYVNNLKEDIIRRDFTINSICMNSKGKIIDIVNGIDDIQNKTIKMIGNIKERLIEDPLRILRAVRISSNINFKIDTKLSQTIKENYTLINNLSKDRIKQELNKILLNSNFKVGLNLLKEYHILDLLEITYNEDILYVSDISGMYAQINNSLNLPFTKLELTNIINIRRIVEGGVINNHILFKYGLYPSLVAAEILNIDRKKITKMYNKLSLKSTSDLKISGKDIMNLLNILPSKQIKDIKDDLINKVLDNKIKNNYNELKKYLLKQ